MTGPPVDLNAKEAEIAFLIADGFRTKQIASKLGITERRVLHYVTALAFKVSEDHTKDDRIMVARWWWANHPKPQAG